MSQLTKEDLINYFAQACKPSDEWRIGTEHELFLYDGVTKKRLPYEGKPGIRQILQKFTDQGWQPVFEKEKIISAKSEKGDSFLTLEPGGQFELSGAPLKTLHETQEELASYYHQLTSILSDLNSQYIPVGFEPFWKREDIPWMPKERYAIMKKQMTKRGTLGLDMMLRTCTVQVNLDYSSEKDMVKKFKVAMALQPIVVALFANSSLTERKPNGFQSYRSHIWQDTDPDRCGFLSFVFDSNMSFERYVDYLLDVPLYFIYREKSYLDAAGLSFRDFMKGNLVKYPGVFPTISDWADQTTVAFPEVRLKQYLEMRGADCGPFSMILALPALWVGLLYDERALQKILTLIESWTLVEMMQMYREVPYFGLKTNFQQSYVHDIAIEILKMADEGLKRRKKLNGKGQDESIYLTPLREIIETGRSLADQLLVNDINLESI